MADPSIMFAQPNAGASFAQAFQQGMAQNQERAAKQAMAALIADPNNAQAMNALARFDPQAAMQFKSQQAEALKAQLAQHQDSILKGAEIIRQFQPKDQASYSQALQAAHLAGVDISQVPQEYNQQYVDGVVKLADALKPQTPHNGQLVSYTPGGGVARINPETGQLETLVVPNTGGQQAGAPVSGGVPHVSDQASYDAVPPGAQYMTPDGHIRVKQGGTSGNAGGGFPGPN